MGVGIHMHVEKRGDDGRWFKYVEAVPRSFKGWEFEGQQLGGIEWEGAKGTYEFRDYRLFAVLAGAGRGINWPKSVFITITYRMLWQRFIDVTMRELLEIADDVTPHDVRIVFWFDS